MSGECRRIGLSLGVKGTFRCGNKSEVVERRIFPLRLKDVIFIFPCRRFIDRDCGGKEG